MAQGDTVSWSHQKFAQVFHQTGNRVEAARAAGSKAKNLYVAGTVLKARPAVMAELERLQNIADTLVVQSSSETKSEVLGLTREAIDIARKGVPLIGKNGCTATDRDGSILRRVDTTGMLKGAELLGKTVAMFTDRHQNASELESKSDNELSLIIEAALASNPMVLEQVARMESVREKVLQFERSNAEAGDGAEGDGETETRTLSTSPETSRTPASGLH